MTAPCRHSVPDPATCSTCGLVEMEDFRAPIVPAKHTLTIAEAEALYPGATVTMDWMIPHIVHGEDVQLKCTKNKKLQASCRLYGTHRRSRVQHLLTRLARWSSPPRPDYPNDFVSASLNRAIESTAYDRLTATWHANVGVWCITHVHFPSMSKSEAAMELGTLLEQLRGHRADAFFIDDVPGYNEVEP